LNPPPQDTAMRIPSCPAAVLLLSFVVVRAAFAGDEALSLTFTNSRHGFSISFPADWAAMTAEELGSTNKVAEAQHPEWKSPLLHYGYRMTNCTGLAFPPYVVIRVTETTTAPDPENVKTDMDNRDGLPEGVKCGEPTFDQDLNAFLQEYSISVPDVPRIESSAAYFLTKKGVIKMFFYAAAVEDGGTAVPIREIIRNVRIHDELRLGQPVPVSRIGLVIALAAMGMMAAVLARAKRATSP